MLTVHLDESHGKANAYAVGGYVATVEQWAEFEREWDDLCAEVNVKYIHKKELEHLWGEFRYAQEWPPEEQKRLKEKVNSRACGIILRRCRAGFGAAVCKTDWQNADKGQWAYALGESFYAAGVFTCFKLISTWLQDYRIDEPVRYVLEAGAEGRTEVEKVFRLTEKSPETMALAQMAGWSFEYKKDRVIKGITYPRVVPLQAADFLAYELYRNVDNRGFENSVIDDPNLRRMRRALLRLLQKDNPRFNKTHISRMPTPHYAMFLNEPHIKILIGEVDAFFSGA